MHLTSTIKGVFSKQTGTTYMDLLLVQIEKWQSMIMLPVPNKKYNKRYRYGQAPYFLEVPEFLILGSNYIMFLSVYSNKHNVRIVPYLKTLSILLTHIKPLLFKSHWDCFQCYIALFKHTQLTHTSKSNIYWKFSCTYSWKIFVNVYHLVKGWLLSVSCNNTII